jgi:hypothetical protein
MLKQDDIRMLSVIDEKPELTITEVKREWRAQSGRADAEAVLNNLHARGLILIERELDTILISSKGATYIKRGF